MNGLRRIDAGKHCHRHQGHGGLHQEAHRKQIGRPEIHGPLHKLRTEQPGEHAARHHPGQRLGPVFGTGAVGRGEAIGLRHRAIKAAEKCRATEQGERTPVDRERRQQSAERAASGADDKGDAPSERLRDHSCRKGACGKAKHVDRKRQGGERDGGRKGRADNGACGEDHGGIGAGQGLRGGEAFDVRACTCVVKNVCRKNRHIPPRSYCLVIPFPLMDGNGKSFYGGY